MESVSQMILVGFFLCLSLARLFGPSHWFRSDSAEERFRQDHGAVARLFDLGIGLVLLLFGALVYLTP